MWSYFAGARRALAAVSVMFAMAAPLGMAATVAGNTPLDAYLADLKTMRATFTQSVVDARGREIDKSSGQLVVSRPGKFRWEVQAAGTGAGQLMVADGRNVWFFDRDLEQVTVKPADAALSATPATLLSGVGDVRENFVLSPGGQRDGLDWVLVEPRKGEADFRRALLGFAKGALKRMILDDKLGQTATVTFDRIERNGRVGNEEVSFTPPKGADVIGKPR